MRRFARVCGSLMLLVSPAIAQEGRPTPAGADASRAAILDWSGCEQAADYSASLDGRAVLVMHGGQVVFERYDNGWSAARAHMLASGTKSFTGVVAMFAVQDGLLTLDERVADTITEWKDDPRKGTITVRHLLTLSSGLEPADAAFPSRAERAGVRGGDNEIGEARRRRIAREDARTNTSKLATGDWFADSLQVPMSHDPGEVFDYGPSHFYVFGELLERKLAQRDEIGAKTFEAYTRERLLQPLDIRVGRWGRDEAGNVNLPGGMMLTAREWAKFGQFVLQHGSWQQPDGTPRQLLRPELLEQCFEPSKANPAYGLTWWLAGGDQADGGAGAPRTGDRAGARALRQADQTTLVIDGEHVRMRMAAGLGKQRLIVLPDLDLVVVRFAEPSRKGLAFENAAFLAPIVRAARGTSVPASK